MDGMMSHVMQFSGGTGGEAAWALGVGLLAVVLLVIAAGTLMWVRHGLDRSAYGDRAVNREDPLDLLKTRYVRGEIDESELDRRLGGLLRHGH